MANENKLTTLGQMQEFATRQDARDDQQEAQIQQMRDNMPTALPNPQKLTLTGAVSATYDGSTAVTVNIPTPEATSSITNDQIDEIFNG